MKKRKTKAIVTGVIGTAMTMMMAGCGASTNTMPSQPNDANCNDWDYDQKTGTYQCDDRGSSYHGHYFYGGSYYGSSSALTSSPSYKSGVSNGTISPNKSTSKSSSSYSSSNSSSSKSGFGSGSKGGSFGG